MADYVSPLGDTLFELLEERGIARADFEQRTGISIALIDDIGSGRVLITPEIARRFEEALGVPAHFWTNRQRQFLEALR
jgi:HTH-type transcriptional regulator/antitoxin HigA